MLATGSTHHPNACSHARVSLADAIITVPGHSLDLVQQLFSSAVSCLLQALLQAGCTHQVKPGVHLILTQVPVRITQHYAHKGMASLLCHVADIPCCAEMDRNVVSQEAHAMSAWQVTLYRLQVMAQDYHGNG